MSATCKIFVSAYININLEHMYIDTQVYMIMYTQLTYIVGREGERLGTFCIRSKDS